MAPCVLLTGVRLASPQLDYTLLCHLPSEPNPLLVCQSLGCSGSPHLLYFVSFEVIKACFCFCDLSWKNSLLWFCHYTLGRDALPREQKFPHMSALVPFIFTYFVSSLMPRIHIISPVSKLAVPTCPHSCLLTELMWQRHALSFWAVFLPCPTFRFLVHGCLQPLEVSPFGFSAVFAGRLPKSAYAGPTQDTPFIPPQHSHQHKNNGLCINYGFISTSESGLVDLRASEQFDQSIPFKDKSWVEEECVPRALLFFSPMCSLLHLLELESRFL